MRASRREPRRPLTAFAERIARVATVWIAVACVAIGVAPVRAQGDVDGRTALPSGFFVAHGTIRLTVDASPLALDLPAGWTDGEDVAFEPASGVRVRLRNAADGEAGFVTVLDLRGRDAGPIDVRVEVEIDAYAEALTARLAPGVPGVALLSLHGAGMNAARGFYWAETDVGLDLSDTDSKLTVTRDGDLRGISVEGRILPGREVAVFAWQRRASVFGDAATSSRSSRRADDDLPTFAGWRIGGGETASRVTAAFDASADSGALGEEFYIELADGWQKGAGKAFKGPARDWLSPEPSSFPDGLAPFVAAVTARSGRVGVWIVPHGFSDDERFDAQPRAFVRDAKGRPISDRFLGRLVVDPTSAEGQDHLRSIAAALRRDGCRVLRIGGLRQALVYYARNRAVLAERETAVDVVAASLAVLRDALGPDALLCGGDDTPEELIGSLDGLRPAWDPAVGLEPLRQELGGPLFDEATGIRSSPRQGVRCTAACSGSASSAFRSAHGL